MVLGQKRADAAKAYMTNLGIDGKLLETISYGKERPVCADKNEECWAKNRRDDFKPLP
jgi:peptidoglycan-associated lipoprotein